MPEQVKFKKPRPNFQAILKKQKEMEDDEKFAISDSLQEYIDTIGKKAGYQNQEKLEKANIRQEVINFVDNYTISSLDSIKGMEFDEAQQLQMSTEKSIAEIEGTGQLNKAELDFIRATVGETNTRLKEVLKVSTRLKFAFRDLKKELKPLKLAARLGVTRIPILGKRVERAIRAEEEGESEALRIKRGLRKREARDTRKMGDTTPPAPNEPSQTQQNKTIAKQTAANIIGQDNQPIPQADREEIVEQERESDTQFETTSGTLERILEETELTNELLGGKKGKKGLLDDDGSGGGIAEGILTTLGLQKLYKFIKAGKLAAIGTSITGFGATLAAFTSTLALAFAAPAFLAFLNRPQGPEELKEMKAMSMDISSSANNEGVTQEDLDLENQYRQIAINKDERNKLINRGDIPETVTLEQYTKAKEEADVGNRITKWWNGDIDNGEVERIIKVLNNNPTTNNSSTQNITGDTTNVVEKKVDGKLNNSTELNTTAMDKSVNTNFGGEPVIVNNQNNVDASNTENKTDFGSSSIGSKNTHYPDIY
jgi:hypothetical protein